VRKFSDTPVTKEVMENIIDTCRFAPSWSNAQEVRYNVVTDEKIIKRIAEEAYAGFAFNTKSLLQATGVVILSYVNGVSGHGPKGELLSTKGDSWSMFDAGIAAQQFALAAYEKGIGTVMQGIFDEKIIGEILHLPDNEIAAVVIPYGYELKHNVAPKRKEIAEIARFYSKN
jgi:nitroreductase